MMAIPFKNEELNTRVKIWVSRVACGNGDFVQGRLAHATVVHTHSSTCKIDFVPGMVKILITFGNRFTE